MALYRYKTRPSADGKTTLIGPETEETPCAICGGEASRQICPGDGRMHHHGCVHRSQSGERSGGLDPICKNCYPQVWAEWYSDLPVGASWDDQMAHRKAQREKAQAEA